MCLAELAREPRRATVDLFFRRSPTPAGARRRCRAVCAMARSDGHQRLKERGGLTLRRRPGGAEHEGMPRAAIATSMVDWVLRAEEMPARLIEYDAREQRLQIPSETGPNPAEPAIAPPSDDEAALREVLSSVRSRTGRDFSYYKRGTIVRRLARRIQVNEVDDMPAYLQFLSTHPGESNAWCRLADLRDELFSRQ